MDRHGTPQMLDRSSGPAPFAPGDGLAQGMIYTAVVQGTPSEGLVAVTVPALHLSSSLVAHVPPGTVCRAAEACCVALDEQKIPWIVASKTLSAPALVSELPAEPLDGQEVYFQNAAMATQGVAWHMRYRSAVGIWEYVGGGNYYSPESGTWLSGAGVKAEVAIPSGPTLTIPVKGEYDIGLQCEMTQRQNGVLGAIFVTVRRNGVVLGTWLPMLATNEWDTQLGHRLVPFGGMVAGDVLSVGALTTQAASMNVNNPRLWIQARKLG